MNKKLIGLLFASVFAFSSGSAVAAPGSASVFAVSGNSAAASGCEFEARLICDSSGCRTEVVIRCR